MPGATKTGHNVIQVSVQLMERGVMAPGTRLSVKMFPLYLLYYLVHVRLSCMDNNFEQPSRKGF